MAVQGSRFQRLRKSGAQVLKGLATMGFAIGERVPVGVAAPHVLRCRAVVRPALFFTGLMILLHLTSPSPSEGAISVTDFRGKRLTLDKPAVRIVCLIESALSGLYMLGAEQRVVGVSANLYKEPLFAWYSALDGRIGQRKLPAPGNWDFVSIEGVLSLRPDLVIIWSQQKESIDAIESRGIPVYGVFLTSWDDVYKEMQDLGALTGREGRAAELVAYTRSELDRFTRRLPPLPRQERPGVYYMWAQGNLETSCGGSTVDDLITLAGGRNVCGGVRSEHLVTNMENLLVWNPDLIVMWYNERKDPKDIIADPQWRTINAVKNRRVHEFPEPFLCDLWTLKFQYAVKSVAKWVNPKLFRDVDLRREGETMLRKLYGRTIKVAGT